ncbi:MobA/MobL family protein [Roseibium sp.]|uniref:MobA/MobL family protein n=1 Tax=Roseibium sp. TaxID=1936156 RepID=UPI003299AB4B
MPMPTIGSRGGKAKVWLEEYEDKSRKNARVIDKLMIALPIELSQEQRIEMLHAYVTEITGGEEISWLAALHDQESHNPHVHMIFRDKGLHTGKRVVEFSEQGSTQRLRESWQKICNEHLAKAGFEARIDTRSLKVQREELLAKAEEATDPDERQKILDAAEKLNRRPSGHEGPEPHAIEADGEVSTKLERLRKIRNEDNAWESYQSNAEFLCYPSAEVIGDLIVDVLDQPDEPQPIAQADQIAADWWDQTFEHEESYCGFVALLSASLKTTDMPSLLAESDKLFEDINTHREHPLIKELDHLAILGRATLQGGWRALPQLTEAMRSYATELGPLTSADALELDLAQHAEDPTDQQTHPAAIDEHDKGLGRPTKLEATPDAEDETAIVHSDAPHVMDAFEADLQRRDAAEALLAAETNLSKARQNLRNAQDILDGKYDLITGERRQSKEKSTFKLRDQSETSEEDARHEELIAMWYDEDGDKIFPSPRPSLTDYDDARTRQRDFDDHFAEWLAGEAARIARAEKNKRRIWEAEFQEKRDQLRAINKLDVGQIIGDVLKLARSIFDWLRDRVLLARNILGEKHDLTKQMKADWGETLAENKKTYDVVVADHQQQTRVADSTAQNTWEQSKTAWAEVELKREELRKAHAAQQTKSRDSGPSM